MEGVTHDSPIIVLNAKPEGPKLLLNEEEELDQEKKEPEINPE